VKKGTVFGVQSRLSPEFPLSVCPRVSWGAEIRLRDFHPKGRLTDEQAEFIAEVIRNRGVG
jgi:hypothetical protein